METHKTSRVEKERKRREREQNKIAELAIYWYRPGCQNIASLLKMERGTRLWTMMGEEKGEKRENFFANCPAERYIYSKYS